MVSSFSHPGGNVTGEGYLKAQLAPKRLQLLHEVVPAAATITLLVNPANPVEAESQTKELQAAAPALGLQLRVAEVTTLDEVERVFTAVASDGKGAIQLSVDPLFGRLRLMVATAARYAVPTVYPWREFVQAGGLMSYGSLILDACRKVGCMPGISSTARSRRICPWNVRPASILRSISRPRWTLIRRSEKRPSCDSR